MFNRLKEKLKDWVKKISEEKPEEEKVEEKIFEKSKEQEKLEKEKHQTIWAGGRGKEGGKEKKIKESIQKIEEHEYIEPEKKEYDEEERKIGEKVIEDIHHEEKKLSIFQRLLFKKRFISEKDFEEYSEELQMILLENNVALEVSDKIIKELEEQIIGKEYSKKNMEEQIKNALKKIIEDILIEPFDLISKIHTKEPKPFIILFCGINGTGKTTTIAKIAQILKKKQITSVMAAADTFRAASIEQIKKHGDKLGIKVISHEYGTDPASVGFDAIKYAERTKMDCVLIDSAGRMHTAKNLLREMEKIKKVCKPDLTIFVGESITGNDATEQVKAFNETIGIDAIVLSKADVDEKGGTALSVGYTTGKPIIYLGTGQEYDKLEKFDKKKFIEKLEL